MHIVIIDYGMGNLASIQRSILKCGEKDILISDSPHDIEYADKLILPGVGAFADGMNNIKEKKLDTIIRSLTIEKKIPLLGICLGMQLLATRGYEWGVIEGLNIIPGEVKKLHPEISTERIPHIGWNEVQYQKENLLFQNIENKSDFYFVHSYHFIPDDLNDVIGKTPYCRTFVSAINHGFVWGVQFHPEKSGDLGFNVLKNFLDYVG